MNRKAKASDVAAAKTMLIRRYIEKLESLEIRSTEQMRHLMMQKTLVLQQYYNDLQLGLTKLDKVHDAHKAKLQQLSRAPQNVNADPTANTTENSSSQQATPFSVLALSNLLRSRDTNREEGAQGLSLMQPNSQLQPSTIASQHTLASAQALQSNFDCLQEQKRADTPMTDDRFAPVIPKRRAHQQNMDIVDLTESRSDKPCESVNDASNLDSNRNSVPMQQYEEDESAIATNSILSKSEIRRFGEEYYKQLQLQLAEVDKQPLTHASSNQSTPTSIPLTCTGSNQSWMNTKTLSTSSPTPRNQILPQLPPHSAMGFDAGFDSSAMQPQRVSVDHFLNCLKGDDKHVDNMQMHVSSSGDNIDGDDAAANIDYIATNTTLAVPFPRHLCKAQILNLGKNSNLDYRDMNRAGQSKVFLMQVVSTDRESMRLHYVGWNARHDIKVCVDDEMENIFEAKSISCRRRHRLRDLKWREMAWFREPHTGCLKVAKVVSVDDEERSGQICVAFHDNLSRTQLEWCHCDEIDRVGIYDVNAPANAMYRVNNQPVKVKVSNHLEDAVIYHQHGNWRWIWFLNSREIEIYNMAIDWRRIMVKPKNETVRAVNVKQEKSFPCADCF